MRWVKRTGTVLLFAVIGLLLALAIVPDFLDARYYRGPASAHFDGERFFNPDGDDGQPVANSGTMVRYVTRSDSRPEWPDKVNLIPARPPARVDGNRMLVTWIGHASVLVQTNGLNILTDPVWSDTVGPFDIGPRRVAEPGIRFEDLPKIDVVLVSHNHYDHMDLTTLKRLWDRDRPVIVTSLGNDSVIESAGIPSRLATTDCGMCGGVEALDWGGSAPVIRDQRSFGVVFVTRNHHWGSRWFSDRSRALWSSFVVKLPGGNLFFAGDTGAGDLKWADEAATYGPVRLALIPIGAFRFTAGQMEAGSHIGPVDAVEVYRRLGAAHGLGIHWGTFRLSYEAWDTPPRLLSAAQQCAGLSGFGTEPLGRTVEVPTYVAPVGRRAVSRAALLKCLDTPEVAGMR